VNTSAKFAWWAKAVKEQGENVTYESTNLFQIAIGQPQREANYCDVKGGNLHPIEEAIVWSH
jgi:hypothetical protein